MADLRGRFTHISSHPSAVVRVQDNKSLPVKDRFSTTVPRNQAKAKIKEDIVEHSVLNLRICT